MDALFRGIVVIGALASLGASKGSAQYSTANFVVHAPSAEFAKLVGDAAEVYRRDLAIEWTGKPLPKDWSAPCPIYVVVGNMGAGGKTTFNFQNGHVYGWRMEVKGSEQRILDSVLPHEINHTIFATLFRRPLPRWADEGAASLIEDISERRQLRQIHDQAIASRRKIPLKSLLEIRQYPKDTQEVLTLYAEGHSLADFLIQRGGRPKYLKLMQMAYERDWETAFKGLYGYNHLDKLERDWDQWVMAGSPKIDVPEGTQVAVRDRSEAQEATIRGQSPAGDIQLSEPIRLASIDPVVEARISDSVPQSSLEEPIEMTQSFPRRKRDRLLEPLLTITRTTTDAAKVSQEPINGRSSPQD